MLSGAGYGSLLTKPSQLSHHASLSGASTGQPLVPHPQQQGATSSTSSSRRESSDGQVKRQT